MNTVSKRKANQAHQEQPDSKRQRPLDPFVSRPARRFANPDTQHLYDQGWVVLRVDGIDAAEIRQAIESELVCFVGDEIAFGGFSATGTPDTFHAPSIRGLRHHVHDTVFKPLLRELADGRHIECVIDRLMKREPGKAPTAESWHRDESVDAHAEDIIVGGWTNLNDTESQFFSAIPRSHRVEAGSNTSGFNTFAKDASRGFKALARRIEIPPGHILVFYQDLVHEVIPTKQKGFTQWRLFTAARLTTQPTPLVADIIDRLNTQATIPVKSGQVSPMYARMHLNFRRNITRLDAFTRANLHPCMHEPYTGKYARDDPETFGSLVKPKTLKRATGADIRESPSLTDLGLPLYPAYTDAELALYTPHTF